VTVISPKKIAGRRSTRSSNRVEIYGFARSRPAR
jgi:hypothetical protein